ncbi:hypothetical protein [Streptomyces sp. NPDC056105]|uniref:hypothetical protein n=1 Tax=Streptomyces sp. NPDC056105 TaxID=3345714 RepID=UPI0035D7609B
MQTDDERTEAEVQAQRKRDLRASLERERDGYKTRGLDDRAEQVEEQLRQLGDDEKPEPESEPDEGGEPDAEERVQAAPLETAVESKPRSTAGRGRGKN